MATGQQKMRNLGVNTSDGVEIGFISLNENMFLSGN